MKRVGESPTTLLISHREDFPEELLSELRDDLAKAGIDVAFHKTPAEPYAAIEYLSRVVANVWLSGRPMASRN